MFLMTSTARCIVSSWLNTELRDEVRSVTQSSMTARGVKDVLLFSAFQIVYYTFHHNYYVTLANIL